VFARVRQTVGDWPFGRWIVIISAAVAVFWFAQGTLGAHTSAYWAFIEGVGAGCLLMVALGSGQRYWRGDKQRRAEISASGTVAQEFGEASEESVATVDDKMNDLFTVVNDRLAALERRVFAESASDSEPAE
jgi:hypothetical protein